MAITIRKLQEQYGGEFGDHPGFPVEDWQQEVAADDTRKGYWEWVKANIEEAEEGEEGEEDEE